jgi:hypothetical protein
MAAAHRRVRKHFRLDPRKIKHAQQLLGAKTETETIERALDLVLSEYERNRQALEANDRFVRGGIEIKDMHRKLDD